MWASAKRESFIRKMLCFIEFAKVFTRESFRLYGTWHNGSLIYGPPIDGERIALRPLFPARGSETSPSFIENCAKTSLLLRKSTIQLSVHHPSDKVSCRVFIPPSIHVHRQKTHFDIFAHAQYNIIVFCRSVARTW